MPKASVLQRFTKAHPISIDSDFQFPAAEVGVTFFQGLHQFGFFVLQRPELDFPLVRIRRAPRQRFPELFIFQPQLGFTQRHRVRRGACQQR